MSNHVLFAKVASEEYCCMHGYFRLCKARGEKIAGMAENLDVSFWTMKYNDQLYRRKKHPCMNYQGCMVPQIEEIEAEAKASTCHELSHKL